MSFPMQCSQSPLRELARPVAAEMEQVERRLENMTPSDAPEVVAATYRRLVEAGGKRLRPLLVLLCCQAAGGKAAEAIGVAVAVEVVHLASLIHDDVIDEAKERRGQPTVRACWGNRISILVGDFLIAETFRQLADEFGPQALTILAVAVGKMCRGELEAADEAGISTEQDYFSHISGKTAALMTAACEIGSSMAADPAATAALRQYGENLGIAFQVTDDLLDLYGDPEALGKPVHQDLLRGQWTLPIIAAMQAASEADQTSLQALLKAAAAGDAASAASATELIARLGGREYALQRAREACERAQQALVSLRSTPARDSLCSLADYVLARTT